MRFNLYKAFAMAAVMAVGTQAINLSSQDSQAIEEHDDFAEIEGCPTTKSGCADNPFCGSCNTGCSSGSDEGSDEKASCRETCDRAVELIRRHNAKKCFKEDAKDRKIAELQKENCDKKKEIKKAEEDAMQMVEDQRKDCDGFKNKCLAKLREDMADLKSKIKSKLDFK